MDVGSWVVLLAAVVAWSLVAGWLGTRSVTMPLVFVAVGLVAGPLGLGWLALAPTLAGAERLTELTLALLLFADASTLDWRAIRGDAALPARLLLIGLPLTVVLGVAAALGLFPGVGLGVALLLAAALAPTDAALGLPIFANERVPERVRRALNVESGFNDGVVTPLVTLAIALALAEAAPGRPGDWLPRALAEILVAAVVGGALGALAGRAFGWSARAGLATAASAQMGGLALALLCYGGSIAAGGNGYIAAFVGGLAFGAAGGQAARRAAEFPEVAGTALSLVVWTLFGVVLAPLALAHASAPVLLYAMLALTLLRMLPVAVALWGTGLRADTVLMMGWLGPRGLATVVFTLIAYGAFREAEVHVRVLAPLAWAVLFSVVLHGLTAGPLAGWYADRLARAGDEVAETGWGAGRGGAPGAETPG